MNLVETPTGPIVPLRYFADEVEHADGQAVEALFLTFNADLSFLEARLLEICRRAGARVTVLADADMWQPDVRAVTSAGRRYHVGMVATSGAFHPKLSMIVGPRRAVAVVGSGNLGMAGWQSNAELATVLKANLDAAPTAMVDLRDLLVTLRARPEVDPLSGDAIARTVDQLSDLLDRTTMIEDTGHRLYASWQGPLLDALPDEPVDEVLVTAAFHDDDSAALERVLQRLQPRRVRVAVQPGRTVVNSDALHRVLTAYATTTRAPDVAVIIDEETRYRHGKLIEWCSDGSRASLTGSPNVSRMALLRPVPYGNFEIAVVGSTPVTLFPAGDEAPQPSALPTRVGRVPGEGGGGTPIITEAVVQDSTLALRIARVTTDVTIELSDYNTPDLWRAIATATARQTSVELSGSYSGGDRVRLAFADAEGVTRRSTVTFVTEPATALRRPNEHPVTSKVAATLPSDLWGDDPAFLQSIYDELHSLTTELAVHRVPAPSDAPVTSPRGETRVHGRENTWLWLQDDLTTRLGRHLGAFTLGLPPIPAPDAEAPDWTDWALPGDPDVAPEHDREAPAVDTESQDAEDDEPVVAVDHAHSSITARRRRRRWCTQAAGIAPQLDVAYRLLLLRITLRLWLLNNWDAHDAEPLWTIDLIAQSLRAPNPVGRPAPPPALRTRIGSLAAVALTLVHRAATRGAEAELTAYQHLRTHVADLIVDASEEEIAAYLDGLIDPRDLEETVSDARHLIGDAADADHLGELERRLLLDDTTLRVERPALNLLHLVANLTEKQTEHRALTLIADVETRPGLGVWVSNLDGYWALVVWNEPHFIRVTPRRNGTYWYRHHQLRGLMTPSVIEGEVRRGQKPDLGRAGTDAQAITALAELGISDPAPPLGSS